MKTFKINWIVLIDYIINYRKYINNILMIGKIGFNKKKSQIRKLKKNFFCNKLIMIYN